METERNLTTADLIPGDRPNRAAEDAKSRSGTAAVASREDDKQVHEIDAPLFASNDASQFRTTWTDIQSGFVDEPRSAVERADSLVADMMKRLAESFANERAALEHQWDRGDKVTTEDLRVALQKYRSFFDRLLKA